MTTFRGKRLNDNAIRPCAIVVDVRCRGISFPFQLAPQGLSTPGVVDDGNEKENLVGGSGNEGGG